LIRQFKFFTEEQDGHKLLWDTSDAESNCQPRNEFTAISLFTSVVLEYCQANNIVLSEESEVGRGIVEFRFPSGYQKRVLMNLKLARNSKLLCGKLDQVSNYISSFEVDYRYFLVASYTTKEVESIDKALAEIATMDFGEVHFRLIVVNVNLPEFSISTSPVQPKQMSNDRLRTVEENLELLRKQVAGKEKAKILAPFEEQARIELGIQELRKLIRPLEDEYWKLLNARSNQVEITEPEAEVVVAELVEQVGQLKTSVHYPDEMLQILQQIYTEVSKPDIPAAAKLKGALSMFPPFVSLGYEVEIDTENFFLTYLPTFAKWYKALARK
jgi:hypothetical protein